MNEVMIAVVLALICGFNARIQFLMPKKYVSAMHFAEDWGSSKYGTIIFWFLGYVCRFVISAFIISGLCFYFGVELIPFTLKKFLLTYLPIILTLTLINNFFSSRFDEDDREENGNLQDGYDDDATTDIPLTLVVACLILSVFYWGAMCPIYWLGKIMHVWS
ncbi:MAG: hypothetical protein WC631_01850 [Candidatus Paceibacterota bacterium]|jgi:hypothetical protein